jgi:hypothetical protein
MEKTKKVASTGANESEKRVKDAVTATMEDERFAALREVMESVKEAQNALHEVANRFPAGDDWKTLTAVEQSLGDNALTLEFELAILLATNAEASTHGTGSEVSGVLATRNDNDLAEAMRHLEKANISVMDYFMRTWKSCNEKGMEGDRRTDAAGIAADNIEDAIAQVGKAIGLERAAVAQRG